MTVRRIGHCLGIAFGRSSAMAFPSNSNFMNADLGPHELSIPTLLSYSHDEGRFGLLMVADSDGHWQISMMLVIVFTQLMTVREATWARVTGRPALGRWIRRALFVMYLCSLLLFAITFWL